MVLALCVSLGHLPLLANLQSTTPEYKIRWLPTAVRHAASYDERHQSPGTRWVLVLRLSVAVSSRSGIFASSSAFPTYTQRKRVYAFVEEVFCTGVPGLTLEAVCEMHVVQRNLNHRITVASQLAGSKSITPTGT